MSTQPDTISHLEFVLQTPGLSGEVSLSLSLSLSLISPIKIISRLDPISYHELSQVTTTLRKKYQEYVMDTLYDVFDLDSGDRRTILKWTQDREERGLSWAIHPILLQRSRAISAADIRAKIFEFYVSMATTAIVEDSDFLFGDHRHFGTLCRVSKILGMDTSLGLDSKAASVHFLRMAAARTYSPDVHADRIYSRVVTTFFLGRFIGSDQSIERISSEMVSIGKGTYRSCYYAAFPLSLLVDCHGRLDCLLRTNHYRACRLGDKNLPTGPQVIMHPLIRNRSIISSQVIQNFEIRRDQYEPFVEDIVRTATSLDDIVKYLISGTAIPTGMFFRVLLEAAERRNLPCSAEAAIKVIDAYADIPLYRGNGIDLTSWLVRLLYYLVRCEGFEAVRTAGVVLDHVATKQRESGYLDAHFDIAAKEAMYGRKICIFAMLHSFAFTRALDDLLLARSMKGYFVGWTFEPIKALADTLPCFRRSLRSSFLYLLTTAYGENDTATLEHLAYFYPQVRHYLTQVSDLIPNRGRGNAKQASRTAIPRLALTSVINTTEWKKSGMTTILPGNACRPELDEILGYLDYILQPILTESGRVVEIRKRGLYDSDDENEAEFKRPRIQ